MSGQGRAIKGTNIKVRALVTPEDYDNDTSKTIALYRAVEVDDAVEVSWLNTLRPERSLIRPAEAFLQGIKKLRPALDFNTFDLKKSKARRVARREKEKAIADKRKTARMAPTAAMKALNYKKVPKTGGHATEEETRLLSRGKKNKRVMEHIAAFQKKKKKLREQQLPKDDIAGDIAASENNHKKQSGGRRQRKIGTSL